MEYWQLHSKRTPKVILEFKFKNITLKDFNVHEGMKYVVQNRNEAMIEFNRDHKYAFLSQAPWLETRWKALG